MIRLALARVGSIRRMVPIIAVIALLTVAVLAVFNSAAAAAPATPHFGPNVMITQTPAYTAGNPSIAVGSDGVGGGPNATSTVLPCSSLGDPSDDRCLQAIYVSFVRDTLLSPQ